MNHLGCRTQRTLEKLMAFSNFGGEKSCFFQRKLRSKKTWRFFCFFWHYELHFWNAFSLCVWHASVWTFQLPRIAGLNCHVSLRFGTKGGCWFERLRTPQARATWVFGMSGGVLIGENWSRKKLRAWQSSAYPTSQFSTRKKARRSTSNAWPSAIRSPSNKASDGNVHLLYHVC